MSSEQVVWVPVEGVDPDASDGYFGVVTLEFIIDDNGRYVCEDMGEGMALCRATTVPAAASVPSEIADTIDAALHSLRRSDRIEMHGNQLERIDAALAWLSTITQEGE